MCFMFQCLPRVYLTTIGSYPHFHIDSDGTGTSPHSGDKDGCLGKVLSDKARLFLSHDTITVKFHLVCFFPSLKNVFK